MTNEELLSIKCRHWIPTGQCGRQAEKIHRACTAPPDINTSQSGDRLDSGGRKYKDGAGQCGHGRIHVEKICKKRLSVAVTLMKPEALPVIVLNGDNSSPNVLVGTGGPKSKSK